MDARPSTPEPPVIRIRISTSGQIGGLGRTYTDRPTRYFALDVVLTAGAEGTVLAKAVGLVRDPDEVVRRKALRFLVRASDDHLNAALIHLADDQLRARTAWLLRVRRGEVTDPEVRRAVDDLDSLTRAFGAVAAAIVAGRDRSLLLDAGSSPDQEIRTFASDELANDVQQPDGGQTSTVKNQG